VMASQPTRISPRSAECCTYIGFCPNRPAEPAFVTDCGGDNFRLVTVSTTIVIGEPPQVMSVSVDTLNHRSIYGVSLGQLGSYYNNDIGLLDVLLFICTCLSIHCRVVGLGRWRWVNTNTGIVKLLYFGLDNISMK
jgi:hypothetical protein